MASTNTILIPARFMLTMGHLIAIIMLFYTKEDNVKASLAASASTAELALVRSSVDSALTLAFICFAFDIVMIFSGTSLFSNTVSVA